MYGSCKGPFYYSVLCVSVAKDVPCLCHGHCLLYLNRCWRENTPPLLLLQGSLHPTPLGVDTHWHKANLLAIGHALVPIYSMLCGFSVFIFLVFWSYLKKFFQRRYPIWQGTLKKLFFSREIILIYSGLSDHSEDLSKHLLLFFFLIIKISFFPLFYVI